MKHKPSNYYGGRIAPPLGSGDAVQQAIDAAHANAPKMNSGKWYGPKSRRVDLPAPVTLRNRKARITLPKVFK